MTDVTNLSANSTVARRAAIIQTEKAGEVVALNIETGQIYGLDAIGSRIWDMIGAPVRIGELCDTLTAEYDIDGPACLRDVLLLLEDLRREGLIETDAASTAT